MRRPGIKDHARGGVDVDGGRAAQIGHAGDVVGEHLGRGVVRRGPAHKGAGLGERARTGIGRAHGRHSRAEINEAQVKGNVVSLLGHGPLVRADHDVGRRDVTMDHRHVLRGEVRQRGEEVAAESRRHERGDATLVVYGELGAGGAQGHALDPLHENDGKALDHAPPAGRRHAGKADQQALGVVLGAEGREARVVDGRPWGAVGGALGKERLQRELLAICVGDETDRAQAASAARGLVGEEDRVPATQLGLCGGIRPAGTPARSRSREGAGSEARSPGPSQTHLGLPVLVLGVVRGVPRAGVVEEASVGANEALLGAAPL